MGVTKFKTLVKYYVPTTEYYRAEAEARKVKRFKSFTSPTVLVGMIYYI